MLRFGADANGVLVAAHRFLATEPCTLDREVEPGVGEGPPQGFHPADPDLAYDYFCLSGSLRS